MKDIAEKIKYIVEKNNLGNLSSFKEIKEGVINENYTFKTDKGLFFLKKNNSRNNMHMRYINDIENFMYDANIPSIVAIGVDEELGYMLYPFIESDRSHDYGYEDYYKMGKMLGLIHSVTFNKAIPNNLKQFSFVDRKIESILEKMKKYEDFLINMENRDETDNLFLEYVKKKIFYAEKYTHIEPLSNNIIVHGDFHPGNLLFSSDNREIIGVCDWEKAQYAPREIDVARACLYIGFGTNTYNIAECEKISETVLSGYRTVLPLSSEEFKKGIQSRIKSNIFSVWIEDKYYIQKDVRANKFIKNTIMILDHYCSKY